MPSEGIPAAFFVFQDSIVTKFIVLVTSFLFTLNIGVYFCIQKNKL